MRVSSRPHRDCSACHCSFCTSAWACTSAFQAVTTLAAACLAMTSTLLLSSLLVEESSSTQDPSAKNELLNSPRLSSELQSLRKWSRDWFSLVSSLTWCCTCAVTFRSVFRHSSKRMAKCDMSARSTTACMARTQSMASAWNARRHMSALEAKPWSSVPAALFAGGEGRRTAGRHVECSAAAAELPSCRASSPSLQSASWR
mmetsp:Transcript_107952/g.315699  ORF Transcript_107952/g.315699 Transcript_107952/m.315699 type:complete len:201 (+) Transcript_107952:1076-1678(+)